MRTLAIYVSGDAACLSSPRLRIVERATKVNSHSQSEASIDDQLRVCDRLAELADLGMEVVAHDLDTRSESAGILGAVLGASSEAYRKEIARRTRRGLEGLARNGKPTGGRAYGYVSAAGSGTGQLEINQEQADVVHRIFKSYANGMSPRAIAALLNEESIPSPGSTRDRTRAFTTRWSMSAIAGSVRDGIGILNNELYIGRVVW